MDSTACLLDMYAAMNRKDFEAARKLALAPKGWLDRGGFYPPNCTEMEVKAYLASVLTPALSPLGAPSRNRHF